MGSLPHGIVLKIVREVVSQPCAQCLLGHIQDPRQSFPPTDGLSQKKMSDSDPQLFMSAQNLFIIQCFRVTRDRSSFLIAGGENT